MKKLLIIIFLLPCLARAQIYVANWTTTNQTGITKYEVQQSKDSLTWVTLAFVPLCLTSCTYTLPLVTDYYRVKSDGILLNSKAVLMTMALVYSSTITLAKISSGWWTDNLSWTTTNEQNVSYYLIQRSSNGGAYTTLTKITAKGNSKYTYSVSKTRKPIYRINAVYKNASSGTGINFQ